MSAEGYYPKRFPIDDKSTLGRIPDAPFMHPLWLEAIVEPMEKTAPVQDLVSRYLEGSSKAWIIMAKLSYPADNNLVSDFDAQRLRELQEVFRTAAFPNMTAAEQLKIKEGTGLLKGK